MTGVEQLRLACRPGRGWGLVVPTLARRHAGPVNAYVTCVYGPAGDVDHHDWWVERNAVKVLGGTAERADSAIHAADAAFTALRRTSGAVNVTTLIVLLTIVLVLAGIWLAAIALAVSAVPK